MRRRVIHGRHAIHQRTRVVRDASATFSPGIGLGSRKAAKDGCVDTAGRVQHALRKPHSASLRSSTTAQHSIRHTHTHCSHTSPTHTCDTTNSLPQRHNQELVGVVTRGPHKLCLAHPPATDVLNSTRFFGILKSKHVRTSGQCRSCPHARTSCSETKAERRQQSGPSHTPRSARSLHVTCAAHPTAPPASSHAPPPHNTA